MQLTDAQLLTAAIAIIFPVSMLIYSNSRVSDLRADFNKHLDEIRKSLDKLDARLDKIDTDVKLLTGKVYEMMGDR